MGRKLSSPGAALHEDGWGRAWLVMVAGLVVLKLVAAATVPLLGDEAFYWWEGRHPALAYSDLPPMTAWLTMAAGEGGHYLRLRLPFLICGLLLPVAVATLSRQFASTRQALGAGLVSMALPLVAVGGLLAVPDAVLNLLAVLLALCCWRALRGEASWLWVGLICALGFLTHLRFAVFAFAAAALVLHEAQGRAALRRPMPWLALALGLSGLAPMIWSELGADQLSFQLVDRHPQGFAAENLLQPLAQALVSTPWLYAGLVVLALATLRQASLPGRSLWLWFGVFPPVFYFVAGLWADAERSAFHWPLPAYAVLVAALPLHLRPRWHRWVNLASIASGAVVSGALLWLITLAGDPHRSVPAGELFPDNMLGWPQVGTAVAHAPGPLVADNFMLAAQLAFETGRTDVRVLDHPLNEKHGRDAQLRTWGLLLEAPLAEGTLVRELGATSLLEQPGFAREACRLLPRAGPFEQLWLYRGRKSFLVHQGGARCDHPPVVYFERADGQVLGWAFDEDGGVASVVAHRDGVSAALEYGVAAPGVTNQYGPLSDPNTPHLGFTGAVPEGSAPVWLEVVAADGGVLLTRAR